MWKRNEHRQALPLRKGEVEGVLISDKAADCGLVYWRTSPLSPPYPMQRIGLLIKIICNLQKAAWMVKSRPINLSQRRPPIFASHYRHGFLKMKLRT